jgi:hypothetical protein
MRYLSKIYLGFLGVLLATAAQAATVPMDEAGFTAYIQKRLQLYAPAPIAIVGPLSLALGTGSDAKPLPSLKPLHDACMSAPATCESAADTFVQNTVHDALQKPAAVSAPGVTTLVACNHTPHTLAIASIYIPVASQQWRSIGWTKLDAGMCRGILATANDVFYARAEEASREQLHDPDIMGGRAQGDRGIASAGGDANMCVRHAGDWDVLAATLSATCVGEARESANFRMFHADGRPVLMWNLAL